MVTEAQEAQRKRYDYDPRYRARVYAVDETLRRYWPTGSDMSEAFEIVDTLDAIVPSLPELPDPDRLEQLADWFDEDDLLKRRTLDPGYDPEVQRDLRKWAAAIREVSS